MKVKRILAGFMTAAMVVTSVPVSGMGAIMVTAAEESQAEPTKRTFANVTVPSSTKVTTYGDAGGKEALTDDNGDTIWHTLYASETETDTEKRPTWDSRENNIQHLTGNNEIIFDLDTLSDITKICYQFKNYNKNGDIKQIELYTAGEDGVYKETADFAGEWDVKNRYGWDELNLETPIQNVKHVKIVATHVYSQGDEEAAFICARGMEVWGTDSVAEVPDPEAEKAAAVEALKAALTGDIKAAGESDGSAYTEDSWKTFKAAYDAAAGYVKEDTDLTVVTAEQITKSKEAVTAAFQALVKASVVPSEDEKIFYPNEDGTFTFTDEDMAFINAMDGFEFSAVYRLTDAAQSSTTEYAIVTLAGESGEYFTVRQMTGGTGAIAYAYKDSSDKLKFTGKEEVKMTDTNWHKLSISARKYSQDATKAYMDAWMDGVHVAKFPWSAGAADTFWKDGLMGTEEQYNQVLVGKKLGSATYTIALENFPGEFQYIKFSKIAENAEAAQATVEPKYTEAKAALVAECEALNADDYTAESWSPFATALEAAEKANTEWAILNTIDALKKAKDALEEHPRVTLQNYLASEAVTAIGTENTENGKRKYTVDSWDAYAAKRNAAITAADNEDLEAAAYTTAREELEAAIQKLELAAQNCECTLGDITRFEGTTLDLQGQTEITVTLGTGEYTYSNGCIKHENTQPSVAYALVENAAGATLTGNTLKVTQPGTVQVCFTVTLGDQKKSATATYTVVKTATEAEKKALDDAVAEAEGKYVPNADKYTADSWQKLANALAEAKNILKDNNASADQVVAATTAINNAIAGLVLIGPTDLDKAKEAVNKALAAADAIYAAGQKDYTDATWKVFADAYQAAKKAPANATVELLKAYANALTKAQNALVKKDTGHRMGEWTKTTKGKSIILTRTCENPDCKCKGTHQETVKFPKIVYLRGKGEKSKKNEKSATITSSNPNIKITIKKDKQYKKYFREKGSKITSKKKVSLITSKGKLKKGYWFEYDTATHKVTANLTGDKVRNVTFVVDAGDGTKPKDVTVQVKVPAPEKNKEIKIKKTSVQGGAYYRYQFIYKGAVKKASKIEVRITGANSSVNTILDKALGKPNADCYIHLSKTAIETLKKRVGNVEFQISVSYGKNRKSKILKYRVK